jgi:hypothetical protein
VFLSDFVSVLNRTSSFYLTEHAVTDAVGRLTSRETKLAYATELLEAERSTFAIPNEALPVLAEMLVEPSSRGDVVKSLYGFGYANPSIDWAGTGLTITMERVFGDEGGSCLAALVPAAWPVELWSSDSDLTDEGRVYYHWVSAKLPTVKADAWDVPMKWVLLSSEIYGTLHWGGHVVSIFRGEVELERELQLDALIEASALLEQK